MRVHRGQPLAGWPSTVVPCGRVAGSRPYGLAAADRAHRWPPLASCCPCGRPPLAGGRHPPCRGALVAIDRPYRGGWPWPTAPLQGALVTAGCPLQPTTASPSSSLFLLRTC
ncbi:hypothetical protein GW17_00040084 [Ensete ventricosum]|nr:hypothetical protein GW17_00040084 [Ensete ventricosum]